MALLLVQAAATLFMTGVIWVVQIVHYPLLDDVGDENFRRYHRRHSRRVSGVVGPAMLAEAGAAAAVLVSGPPAIPRAVALLGVLLVGVIWIATAFLLVPRHNMLARGFDARAHAELVAANWVRTVSWTARSALVLWMLARAGA